MKHDRVCLITGGVRGLGRVLSLTLLKKGYTVISNYVRSVQEASEMKDKGCIIFRADISRYEECIMLRNFITERFGMLHALINNAAITRDELLIKLRESDWDDVTQVNLKGVFNTITIFSDLLEKTRGHIVNISSYSGIRGKAGQSAYSASKAGLIGLSLVAARELSQKKIKVNVVAPGYMETDMGRASPRAMEVAKDESLLKTLTSKEEVAGFIAFLLETETITGQVFRIDSRI
ncbi:MAG: SDR family NAD(P)-dependent oxidoreductase [Thermodesulfovibrionales bacterium]